MTAGPALKLKTRMDQIRSLWLSAVDRAADPGAVYSPASTRRKPRGLRRGGPDPLTAVRGAEIFGRIPDSRHPGSTRVHRCPHWIGGNDGLSETQPAQRDRSTPAPPDQRVELSVRHWPARRVIPPFRLDLEPGIAHDVEQLGWCEYMDILHGLDALDKRA